MPASLLGIITPFCFLKPRLILVFLGVVTLGIMGVGFLFNVLV